jgi:hypothetical protein
MNTFKKGLFAGAAALAMSMTAQAGEINVGGVVWDPNSAFMLPALNDFFSSGTLIETATNGAPGNLVTGSGVFSNMNSAVANTGDFCPSCELTFTFSMNLVGTNGIDFTFENLNINIFVDDTPDYSGASATAADGDLWLSLANNGFLTGVGTNIGTGSDTGTGSALLDVTGGLAMGNFDTNKQVNGADMVFSSSFQPLTGAPGFLSGTFELTGDSIPEPSTIALLGLGLLGFAGARKRKA